MPNAEELYVVVAQPVYLLIMVTTHPPENAMLPQCAIASLKVPFIRVGERYLRRAGIEDKLGEVQRPHELTVTLSRSSVTFRDRDGMLGCHASVTVLDAVPKFRLPSSFDSNLQFVPPHVFCYQVPCSMEIQPTSLDRRGLDQERIRVGCLKVGLNHPVEPSRQSCRTSLPPDVCMVHSNCSRTVWL